MSVKAIIKRLCPTKLWNSLRRIRLKKSLRQDPNINRYQQRYDAVLNRIKTKQEPLNVLFLALEASSWKYDSLYLGMLKDPCFNPSILVCPQVNRGYDYMIERMNICAEYFKKKHYQYIITYDEKKQTYLDAQSLNPDLVFYTNPYDGLIAPQYYIDKLQNSLTCYINYAYNNHIHEFGFNLPFHRYLWRYYVECKPNFDQIKSYSPINAINCRITGYPMYDAFASGMATGKDWKLNDKKHKRIIWSPHHTIDGQDEWLKFSTFLLYYDTMLELARKYKDYIEIAFKPHPVLKANLYKHPDWGKERSDNYYEKWANGENTTFVDGEYVDLFKSSDAMINDSGSFTIEYLYMQKPCLYLNNYNRQKDSNEAASKAFDCWYHATSEDEIEQFVADVVLEGKDTKRERRENFYKKVLLPPNGCSVAENIINDIKSSLK